MLIAFMTSNLFMACKTSGFIVTNEGKTIEGRFKVVKYEYPTHSNEVALILDMPLRNNPYMASLQQKEILGSKDFYDLYHTVFFREKNGSRFREYFPEDIKAFSFEHKGQSYFFYSKSVIYNQWGREKANPYFLKLISKGEVALYQLHKKCMVESTYIDYFDFVVENREGDLVNVTLGREKLPFKDFLQDRVLMESEFVEQLDARTDYNDIVWVVKRYNAWVLRRSHPSRSDVTNI
ncbi:hypothetical protein DMA11_00965 [Marinilabiliaceae bacterium JC017]|nr:hypothetical protein DMA11_00965 [Marinilabiliaceae bacterium JC017]